MPKHALITGASRRIGIAAAVARRLAPDGWNITTTCLRSYDAEMPWGSAPDEADDLIREIRAHDIIATLYEDDLSDPHAPARIFDAAEASAGMVDALVNVHTYSTHGGLVDVSADEFDRHIAVNSRGTLLMMAEFARRWRGEPGTGRIVNFTSGLPLIGAIAYAASKGAIEWLTISAAGELAPRGISVNAVNPGPNDTGWMPPELYAGINARSPMGRVGTPQDAAELVAFLVSPVSGWITAQVLNSNAGWSKLLA